MNAKEMWNLYIKDNHVKNKTYEAWSFGGSSSMADELGALVLKGVKTSTASAYKLYELEKEPLPVKGGMNIILDSEDNALCITETTKIYTCPFFQVSEDHAFKEGEGDRSLTYWRKVHRDFFSKELREYDLEFLEN